MFQPKPPTIAERAARAATASRDAAAHRRNRALSAPRLPEALHHLVCTAWEVRADTGRGATVHRVLKRQKALGDAIRKAARVGGSVHAFCAVEVVTYAAVLRLAVLRFAERKPGRSPSCLDGVVRLNVAADRLISNHDTSNRRTMRRPPTFQIQNILASLIGHETPSC